MAFECFRCGECCTSMGLLHRVDAENGDGGFSLANTFTGERTEVRVAADKQALYDDRSIFSAWPDACPFLRFDPHDGKGVCTVYPTWPEICREFGCWRLAILDATGCRVGRVMPERHLDSNDAVVRRIWDAVLRRSPKDDEWEDWAVDAFETAGYTVQR